MTKLDTTIWLYATQDLSSLLKVLHSYNNQNYRLFEVLIIANENFEDLKEFLDSIEEDFFFSINLSNNEDAFNKSNTEYIVLSNIQTVVHKTFVEEHVRLREEGFYVRGKQTIFPSPKNIEVEDIYNNDCFEVNWLRENGFNLRYKQAKIVSNVSAWKTDLKTLETSNYFESQRGLLSKLIRLPRKAKKLRSQLICLHLQSK